MQFQTVCLLFYYDPKKVNLIPLLSKLPIQYYQTFQPSFSGTEQRQKKSSIYLQAFAMITAHTKGDGLYQ